MERIAQLSWDRAQIQLFDTGTGSYKIEERDDTGERFLSWHDTLAEAMTAFAGAVRQETENMLKSKSPT